MHARRTILFALFAFLLPVMVAVGIGMHAHAAAARTADAHGAASVAAPAKAAPAAKPIDAAERYEGWEAKWEIFANDQLISVGAQILGAILLFIAGWIVAKMVSYGVFQLLQRTELDNKVAQKLGIGLLLGERKGKEEDGSVERFVAETVYWTLMLLVVVGVLDFVGLELVASPIGGLVDTVIQALPHIGKAILILLVAYVAGRILKMAVTGLLSRAGIDQRLSELAEQKRPDAVPFSEGVGRVLFWLIMVFGLAGSFDALHIDPIARPLHNAIDYMVGILPRVGVAVLLVLAGWFGGRIVRAIVRNLLQSVGFDRLAARVHLDKVTGSTSPSAVVATAVMVFIVLQAVIAALDELSLETLSGPLTGMMEQFWSLLPALVVSILIVVAGVFVGKLLRGVVAGGLRNLGFDRFMERLGFRRLAERPDRLGEYSELVGYVVQLGVIGVAVAQSFENLELETWAAYLDALLSYSVKNVVIALLVVGIGFAVGNYVRDLVRARQGDDEVGRWMGEFARYAILVFAFTAAVRQLDVAEDFVLVTFGLLFGALCLAAALAFGLGGRAVAGEILERRYRQARQALERTPTARPGGTPSAPPPKTPVGE